MSEVEKIKAEIRRDGTRRIHGHELHDLIDRVAVAAARDRAVETATLVAELTDRAVKRVANIFADNIMKGAPIGKATVAMAPLISDLAGPFGRPVNDDRAD